MSHVSKKIMRRVYYAYALSYTEQPMLYVGLLLGGAVALFGRWTHVASITENLLATPVGSVPGFVGEAFTLAVARGELGTVLVVLTMASLTAVALWQLSRLSFAPRLQVA